MDKFIGVIFLDLIKAFDTVDHDILVEKIQKYGADGNAMAWFRNYLYGRTRITRVSGKLSSRRSITYGVPWGSILGPFLVILYINDLYLKLGDSRINLYVDGTALYCTNTDIAGLILSL